MESTESLRNAVLWAMEALHDAVTESEELSWDGDNGKQIKAIHDAIRKAQDALDSVEEDCSFLEQYEWAQTQDEKDFG